MINRNRNIVAVIIGIVFYIKLCGWSPFSKSDWQDVGNKIKGGVEDVGNKIKGGLQTGIDKAKACSEVVSLGSEWAAKQAAFQTAKGALTASEQLQKADPRLTGLLVAEKSAQLGLKAAEEGLSVAQKASEGIAAGTKLLGDIASNAFNIESMSFETTSEQLMKNESPPIKVVGTIAGQHFDITIQGVDFSNSDTFVNSVLKNLKL